MKNLLILILINSINFSLKSQNYLFPINNNSQNFLSGNLGGIPGGDINGISKAGISKIWDKASRTYPLECSNCIALLEESFFFHSISWELIGFR